MAGRWEYLDVDEIVEAYAKEKGMNFYANFEDRDGKKSLIGTYLRKCQFEVIKELGKKGFEVVELPLGVVHEGRSSGDKNALIAKRYVEDEDRHYTQAQGYTR